MATEYQPEIVQMLTTARFGHFQVPDYAEALIFGVIKEIDRVYWNTQQESFDSDEMETTTIASQLFAPMAIRAYCWEDEPEDSNAWVNLEFEDVRIFWYKHCGRGMSTDRDLSRDQWIDWFDQCLNHVKMKDLEWLLRNRTDDSAILGKSHRLTT